MSIANKLVLLALIGLVLAGGSYRQDSRLRLSRSRRNVLNFACGAYGSDGTPSYYGQQSYSYTFSGHPSWLSVRGSSLYGVPPAGERGPWYVSVGYRGDRDSRSYGTSRYELDFDDAPAVATVSVPRAVDTVYYTTGAPQTAKYVDPSDSSYIVLVPIISTETRTVYEKQPDTIIQQAPVSCTTEENAYNSAATDLTTAQGSVSTISSRLADALALVDRLRSDLATAQGQVSTAQSSVQQTSNDLSGCRSRQAAAATPIVVPGATVAKTESYNVTNYVAVAVGGYETSRCGAINVEGRGHGLITEVGSDYVVIAGQGQLNFGACTERSYRTGRNYFTVADTVSYETYTWGGKRWGRRVICQ